MWKEVIELHFPNDPDAGLLLAWEDGYNTWELESVVDMHNRDWEFFRNTIVPDLVSEAKEGRVSKVIGIDTVDRMIDNASDYIIRKWNKKYGTQYESIQEFNENIKEDNVWIALKNEIWDQIDKLKKAGYGMIWLAWTKEKETTTIDGLKYNSIELMMSNTGRKIFESQAHLIVCLHTDVTVVDKDGEELDENLKNKKNKEIASNFHQTQVNMYFRPSNYINIAGGRFTELPEKVEYSAENFLKVFENAVKGQLKKTTKTVDALKEEQGVEREENAKEFADKKDVQEESADIIKQIDTEIIRLKKEKKAVQIGQQFKDLFEGNAVGYKDSEDVGKLKEALKLAKSVK